MRFAPVVALALVLAGCGGGDDEQAGEQPPPAQEQRLTPAEYARRVDELCSRVIEEVAPLQERARTEVAQAGSEREQMRRLADVLDTQLAAVTRFRADVEVVPLPTAYTDDARLQIEKTKEAEQELSEAIAALRTGEAERATAALRTYAALSLESAAAARDSELPFAVCGSGA